MRRSVLVLVLASAWLMLVPQVVACSPPFEEPTIEALGRSQIVLVGTTGERVDDGRLFHVERVFNGTVPESPIVIAFKEGEAVGDCSYPVVAGTRLVIAPSMSADGALSADLATLQADPDTDLGRRYVDEAIRLFGPGSVPVQPSEAQQSEPAAPMAIGLGIMGALALVAVLAMVLLVRRRSGAPS